MLCVSRGDKEALQATNLVSCDNIRNANLLEVLDGLFVCRIQGEADYWRQLL